MATSPVTLDFSRAQPISTPVTLDFTKAQPVDGSQPTQDWLAKALGQKQQTGLERALQPTQHDPNQGVMGNAVTALSNIGAAGLNALTHPEQLVTSAVMSSPPVQAYTAARDFVKHLQGQPNATDEQAKHPVQNLLQNVESAAGTAGAMGLPEAIDTGMGSVSNGVQMAKNWMRPPTSPSVVPRNEFAARQLSAAVLPAGKDAANFINAAKEEVPNILDYAKQTGNPLNTQLEFSKAAQGYAQQVRGVYENNVLGPSANKLVRTTGTGYGQRMGEGPDTYATLGDIDKRITALNTQLDAPTLNADDARRALATKSELKAEAAGLRDILHKNLSETTGLTPDQIANLRQRVGRSYELANDTDAAVTARMQSVGKADLKPVKFSELPSQAYQYVQGGPVPIADRAFQRAIKNFPGQSQPLPAIQPPAPQGSSRIDALIQAIKDGRS